MKLESDLNLFDSISRSDYAAFSELYGRYWKKLLYVAVKKVGEQEEAMDIVQDLFTDIWQNRHAIRIKKTVEAYLLSSLYNKIFMYFRSVGIKEKHIQGYAYLMAQLGQGMIDIENDTLYEEQLDHLLTIVEQTIDAMPEKMKTVFQLRYRKSKKVQEIAGIVGISAQTVKNHLAKAMLKLRKAVDGQTTLSIFVLLLYWLHD